MEISVKIEILVKNRNFSKNRNIEVSMKNRNFGDKNGNFGEKWKF